MPLVGQWGLRVDQQCSYADASLTLPEEHVPNSGDPPSALSSRGDKFVIRDNVGVIRPSPTPSCPTTVTVEPFDCRRNDPDDAVIILPLRGEMDRDDGVLLHGTSSSLEPVRLIISMF